MTKKSKSPYTIEASPTIYKGFEYRSKLEAHFASFFVALGIDFRYEPDVFELDNKYWYLPDYKIWFPDNEPRWIEVKGPNIYREARMKAEGLARETSIITQMWCGNWGKQVIHSFVPHKKRVWYKSHTTLDAKWFKFWSTEEMDEAIKKAYFLA